MLKHCLAMPLSLISMPLLATTPTPLEGGGMQSMLVDIVSAAEPTWMISIQVEASIWSPAAVTSCTRAATPTDARFWCGRLHNACLPMADLGHAAAQAATRQAVLMHAKSQIDSASCTAVASHAAYLLSVSSISQA